MQYREDWEEIVRVIREEETPAIRQRLMEAGVEEKELTKIVGQGLNLGSISVALSTAFAELEREEGLFARFPANDRSRAQLKRGRELRIPYLFLREELRVTLPMAHDWDCPDIWQDVVAVWLGRILCLQQPESFGSWFFSVEGFELKLYEKEGLMGVVVKRHGALAYKLSPMKPTKLLAKLYGEKIATAAASKVSMKNRGLEVCFTTKYIPECYLQMKRDENLESCMSKPDRCYSVPEGYHPTMAYENSPNAVLVLLWDTGKKRFVSRAIGKLEGSSITWVKAYGTSGREEAMNEYTFLSYDGDVEGLCLSKVEVAADVWLLPYVDGPEQLVTDNGDYLVVDVDGEYEANYEMGTTAPRIECICCGRLVGEVAFYSRDDAIGVCCEDDYRWCEDVDDYVHYSDCVYCEDIGEYRAEDYLHCDYTEYYYAEEGAIDVVVRGGAWNYHWTVARCNLEDLLENEDVISVDGELLETEEDEEDAA